MFATCCKFARCCDSNEKKNIFYIVCEAEKIVCMKNQLYAGYFVDFCTVCTIYWSLLPPHASIFNTECPSLFNMSTVVDTYLYHGWMVLYYYILKY